MRETMTVNRLYGPDPRFTAIVYALQNKIENDPTGYTFLDAAEDNRHGWIVDVPTTSDQNHWTRHHLAPLSERDLITAWRRANLPI